MGKKGSWFSSVKRAFSPNSKKSKKSDRLEGGSNGTEKDPGSNCVSLGTKVVPPLVPQQEEVKVSNLVNEQNKHAYCVEVGSSTVTGNASVASTSSRAAKEVVRYAKTGQLADKSKEEIAVVKIQTAFRGYMARRALRALRGLVRLKTLMEGPTIRHQSMNTIRHMQTLSRVQSQIRSRRIRVAEENQALQKQLLQKHARELEKLQIGEEWDDSSQSKEQIEAKLLRKYEATMRRERALAYAFSHQNNGKNSSRSLNLMFMDPNNPAWGWSWLERFMAARPVTEKDPNNDNSSVKSASRSILGGEISKAYAKYQLSSSKLSPTDSQKPNQLTNLQSPATPSVSGRAARKIRSAGPKVGTWMQDDDCKSTVSTKSYRRHSVAGPSVRDDESLASSQAIPSYMVPTESARARLKSESSYGIDQNGYVGAAKKRLSFPSSPARSRRHSGPPKLDTSINSKTELSNPGDS